MTNVKIIGVGAAGINVLNRVIESVTAGVSFMAVDFDTMKLEESKASVKFPLKPHYWPADDRYGELWRMTGDCEKQIPDIQQAVGTPDAVIMIAGLGNSTGSTVTPVFAKAAKEAGALTIAVVTQPFAFEGLKAQERAMECIYELRPIVDAVIVIPDESFISSPEVQEGSITAAFEYMNKILIRTVKCLLGIMALNCFPFLAPPSPNEWGLEHLAAVAKAKDGKSLIGRVGIGSITGIDRIDEAARMAVTSPFLDNPNRTPDSVLMQVAYDPELPVSLDAIHRALDIVHKASKPTVDFLSDVLSDNGLKGEICILVIYFFERDELRIAI